MLLLDDVTMTSSKYELEFPTPRGGKRPRTTPSISVDTSPDGGSGKLLLATFKCVKKRSVTCEAGCDEEQGTSSADRDHSRSHHGSAVKSSVELTSNTGGTGAQDSTVRGEAEAMAADEACPSPSLRTPRAPILATPFPSNNHDKSMTMALEGRRSESWNAQRVYHRDSAEHPLPTPEPNDGVVVGRQTKMKCIIAPAYEPLSLNSSESWLPPFNCADNHRPQQRQPQRLVSHKQKEATGVPRGKTGLRTKRSSSHDGKGKHPGRFTESESQHADSGSSHLPPRAADADTGSNPECLPPSPGEARETLMAKIMGRSDEAYQSVRQDLVRYMEGVRRK